MEKTNDEPVNANYTFDSEKLLSIPLQQGEPPKHSTPKSLLSKKTDLILKQDLIWTVTNWI